MSGNGKGNGKPQLTHETKIEGTKSKEQSLINGKTQGPETNVKKASRTPLQSQKATTSITSDFEEEPETAKKQDEGIFDNYGGHVLQLEIMNLILGNTYLGNTSEQGILGIDNSGSNDVNKINEEIIK